MPKLATLPNMIFEHIEKTRATVITPNRRLSAMLHKHYQQYQLAHHVHSWPTPTILPVTSWIQRLWTDFRNRDFQPHPLQLNPTQEHFLWEKILNDANVSDPLLQLSETADLAKTAWGLLKQWRVDIDQPIFKSALDYAAFHDWALQFQTMQHKQAWFDSSSLPDRVATKIQSAEIVPPSHLILVGFTEVSPQLTHLLTVCQEAGTQISTEALRHDDAVLERISLNNKEEEIYIIARWAKAHWTLNKEAHIGCVMPALDKIRDRVVQVFAEVFAADETYKVDTQTCPFNVSAGKKLIQYPIVFAALQLLSLNKKNISMETMSYLLTSPFLGDAENERIKRANFDSLLRQENQHHLELNRLISNTLDSKRPSLNNHCPRLAQRLRDFLTHAAAHREAKTHTDWAAIFAQGLTLLGWPGERSLSSEEYQVVENWLKLMAEFGSLDYITAPVRFHQALQTLHNMVAKAVFQPQTPEAPIQILGALEAAGAPFDYLWVAGMDDLSWPPAPKPHPLLPKKLQRELHMSHATAERELHFCETLIRQFKQSASKVIFSHAEKQEEIELQSSPLIRDIPAISLTELNLPDYHTPAHRIYSTQHTEYVEDFHAPHVQAEEKIRGGVSVIKSQAMCPFKSFAEWRLHAHALESPLPGMRQKDRGTLIHKVLELVWNQLGDQATLKQMTGMELRELVEACTQDAFSSFTHLETNDSHYIALEKQRLHKLITDWLQVEKERAPFKVVASEVKTQFGFNQLTLSMRIDRIDELEDGKKLIIDYKTGKHNDINHWFSERPEEPQLPLYSLLDADSTTGISFAQITPGEHCFKGVSRYALEIKGIKLLPEIKKTTALSWDDQLTQWNGLLTQLSQDFQMGVAKVDPKDPVKTCQWCALKPLCRINEISLP